MKPNYFMGAIPLVILAAAPASFAQAPFLINYQGRVQEGNPLVDVNVPSQFRFALVDESPVPFTTATATVVRSGANQSLTGATFTVTNGGSGYTTAPLVTVSAPQVGGGVQAVVAATVAGGSVTGFTVTTAGSGYTANPTLTIAAPPARTATIIWNNNGPAPADPVNAVTLPVSNGLYSVLIGDTTITNMAAIPTSVLTRPDLRLRVWFKNQRLIPDQRIVTNGYLPSGTKVAAFGGGGGASPDTNGLQVFNHVNTAGNDAILSARVAGTGGGNPFLSLDVSGETGWSIGLDNADGNKLKFSNAWNNLNMNPKMALDTAGNLLFHGDTSHSIYVERPSTNVAGNNLEIGAGHASPPPDGTLGFARAGGALILKGGNAYGNFAGILGGNVTISSGTAAAGDGNILLYPGSGGVGIHVGSPLAPLHVGGGSLNSFILEAYLDLNGATNAVPQSRSDLPHSIIADNRIRAAAFDVASDQRIKKTIGRSDAVADLNLLRRIEITDYTHQDTVTEGTTPQKKVIAQQVEAVLPAAVTRSTNCVPDIYLAGKVEQGWIQVATTLQAGDRVRIIGDQGPKTYTVAEARADGFRTSEAPDGAKVFVYGREVKDFRSVDYDAIAMLNVSATQELARQLEAKAAAVNALQAANAALQQKLAEKEGQDQAQNAKLAALEAKDQARDAELAALVKLLKDQTGTVTVANRQ